MRQRQSRAISKNHVLRKFCLENSRRDLIRRNSCASFVIQICTFLILSISHFAITIYILELRVLIFVLQLILESIPIVYLLHLYSPIWMFRTVQILYQEFKNFISFPPTRGTEGALIKTFLSRFEIEEHFERRFVCCSFPFLKAGSTAYQKVLGIQNRSGKRSDLSILSNL
ncbi:uncharacterized protein LOC123311557 [Coccinella septempunctata]|uniref:uncharacterized protein LOC123311557 n=1 Tax=Coccinella septempunctata TaxID=41139 RepID=UPI001D06BC2D|nr:uncharacterized protein LOC123311557 [Coccinella septempunctata]